MEAATVVSIVPARIWERKPMIPSEFLFDRASEENPSLVHISNGLNDIYVGDGRGHYGPERSVIRVPIAADTIAASIVNDWIDSQLGVIKPEIIPGFFWVPGHVHVSGIDKEIQEASNRQVNWFKNLVKIADDDWQKTKKHKTISDIQRFAASYLKLDRAWLMDAEIARAMSECPSCFEKVNPKAIVCAHCRYVLDAARFKAAQFAQV